MVATISAITSGSSRVRYFEQEGYYAKDDPAHRQASRWYGSGALELGLTSINPSGEYRARSVSPEAFEAVLDGQICGTDITLGRIRDGVREHRPGFDITLSAPKSVSIERIFNPKLIDKCHDAAVMRTLDFIEHELIETRIWDPATRRRDSVSSPSMVAATFRHEASRNLDTNLHTHCIVANMTHEPGSDGSAGKWRSIEPTALRQNIRLIGAYYRNELAVELENSGFAVNRMQIGRIQGFEIAGYDRHDIEAFSTRRMDILAYMEERGWAYNTKNAQQAALDTRPAKHEPDRAAMFADWQSRAAELGLASQRLPIKDRSQQLDRVPPMPLLEQVCQSIAHLEERQSVFPARDLLTDVMGRQVGRYKMEDINAAIGQLVQDGHLVPAKLSHAVDAFVTDKALKAERGIIAEMNEGRGAASPVCSMADVRKALDTRDLTDGQRDALGTILTSEDRIVGIQGRAGAGKTVMLGQLPKLLADRPLLALAPSSSATQTLASETGITSKTLSWFLTRYQGVADGSLEAAKLQELRSGFKDGVLVIDEASMISTDQMRRLFGIAKGLEIDHIALIGDTKQLRAVQAGQPFRQLQEAGMQTAMMDEMLRQRNPELKHAVEHVLDGQPAMALESLAEGRGGQLIETPDLAEKAAELWLALPAEARDATALLAPTHMMRAEIHDYIRQGLRDEGTLHGQELTITRLINTHMTRAQLGDPANYHKGDVVRFHQDVVNHRVKAGDAYRVMGHDVDTASGRTRVQLADDNGNRRHIDPTGTIRYRLSVYETAEMTLQAGDHIRWTANAPKTGEGDHRLLNGGEAEIAHIGRDGIMLHTDDGREISMKADDPQLSHCDHSYSSTIHAAQGITRDNVIAVLESGHGQLTDQQSFYVELSRARDNAVVLTDNIAQLTETLTANTGERLTALEAVGEKVPAQEMGREAPQIELVAKVNTHEHDLVQAHEDDPAQNHDLALTEAIRELPTVSLEECEAEWRELDQADEKADYGADRTIDNGGELERSIDDTGRNVEDAEKDKDRDFGMEM